MNIAVKRIRTILLFSLSLVFMFPAAFAHAETVTFSNLETKQITDSSLTITWYTSTEGDISLPASSKIEYGTSMSYGAMTSEDKLSYWHSIKISGLTAGALYHYRIIAKDYDGVETVSSDYTFTTKTSAELESSIRAARTSHDLPNIYYVKTDGNDSNDGLTPNTAWQHPSYATQIAEAGDVVNLVDDIWNNEKVSFANSGIDVAPIVVKAYSGSPTLIGDGTGNAFGIITGDISHYQYIEINGITIQNYASGIYLEVSGVSSHEISNISIIDNHITGAAIPINARRIGNEDWHIHELAISGNHLSNFSGSGIFLEGARDSLIANNTIEDSPSATGWVGIGYLMQHCVVENNTLNNLSVDYGISGSVTAGVGSSDNTVRNNSLTNLGGVADRRGIRFDYYSHNNFITGNTINTTTGAGMNFYPGNTVIVDDNSITNSSISFTNIDKAMIRNNILDHNSTSNMTGGGGYSTELTFENNIVKNYSNAYFDLENISSGTFKNNIFENISAYGVFIFGYVDGTPSGNITFSNNVFYNINGKAIYVGWSVVDNLTLKNNIFMNVTGQSVDNDTGDNVTVAYNDVWNSGSTYFAGVTATNTQQADPLFADPANGDFHLKSQYGRWNETSWATDTVTSSLIDAGDPSDSYTNEPSSNGGRINIGSYGNTVEASKSSSVVYPLTVTSGSGSGSYASGTQIAITANTAPAGQIFDKWTGDTTSVVNVNSSSTAVIMPAQAISVTATYKNSPTISVSAPTFSPAAGTYTSAQTVVISSATSGATIYYTTDGSTPTPSSPVYSSAIAVSSTKTIKALAVKSGNIDSPVSTAVYIISIASGGTGGAGGSEGGGGTTSLVPTIIKTEVTSVTNNQVNLTLNVTNATQMMLSDNSSFTGSTWETYATTKTYTKTDTQTKLYLKFKSSTDTISSTIELNIPTNTTTTTPDTNPYPTGTLLKLPDSPKVYVIIDNKKKWISTPEVFQQLGYQWTNILTVTQTQLNTFPDYEDNLIRAINDYKVYLVVNGVKRHIPNPIIFLDYGFKWNEVKDVPQETIDKYKPTYLIKQSGTNGIYYVNSQEIRKLIPSTEVFNSYNDKQEDIQIISKTEMDSYPLSNLIKLNSSNDIYLIEGNIKKRIPNPQVFNKYKLNWNLVMSVNQTEFNFYSDGGELK